MTQSRRIVLNICATYGRSLYALLIGLCCGRWTLQALGAESLGLMGVVGGLASFVTFFLGIMSAGISRFYAVSVGTERIDYEDGVRHCQEWFSVALIIHIVVPVVLVITGWPLGEWAVSSFLTIPRDKVQDCLWIWRITCCSSLIGMMSVPFSAMYTAKQEIAELTIYSFCTTTLNFFFMYYVIHHPGDWLVGISLFGFILFAVPQMIIVCRAICKYRECRFNIEFRDIPKMIRKMLGFSAWLLIGNGSELLRNQGVSVLVNKAYGPAVNAAMSIGGSVSGHCTSFSGSLIGAFSPAIYNAYGSGDLEQARKLALRVCKLSSLFVLVFAVPLVAEINAVLTLWLKNPPVYTAGLCGLILLAFFIDKMTVGHMIIVAARGKIGHYQMCVGGIALMTLPLAGLFVYLERSVYYVGLAIVIIRFFQTLGRVLFARHLVGLSAKKWLVGIVLPITVIIGGAALFAALIRIFMQESLVRILVTSCCVDIFIAVASWCCLLDGTEKKYMLDKIHNSLEWFSKKGGEK